MNRYLNKEEKEKIKELIEKGITQNEISKIMKRSNSTILNFARKEKLTILKKDKSIWSKEELLIIKKGLKIKELNSLLKDKTEKQIINKIRKLKIIQKNQKHSRWSNEEDKILDLGIKSFKPIKEIKKELKHRTLGSIYHRLSLLCLTKYKEEEC